jgi:endoglucanase
MSPDLIRQAARAMVAWRVRLLGIAVAVVVAVALSGDAPPLSLVHVPSRHPFRTAHLFVDHTTGAAKWQAANQATWLDRITRNPQARWLNDPRDLQDLPGLVRLAEQRHELLVLVTYYVPNRDCGGTGSGAATSDDYAAFIDGLVAVLGTEHAAIIVEPDAVAAECFDGERAALLRRAVRRLDEAGQHVYLDAGHPRWRSDAEMARRLRAAGVAYAQGFSVNVANRQTTKTCYTWARKLSRRLGDMEFVIDTSRNGVGPSTGYHAGNPEWCNPPRQALGEEPTTRTGRPGLAALLWIKPPGESDGYCGGEVDHSFSPRQAENLIGNAPPR